jgi:hypothetical protein
MVAKVVVSEARAPKAAVAHVMEAVVANVTVDAATTVARAKSEARALNKRRVRQPRRPWPNWTKTLATA